MSPGIRLTADSSSFTYAKRPPGHGGAGLAEGVGHEIDIPSVGRVGPTCECTALGEGSVGQPCAGLSATWTSPTSLHGRIHVRVPHRAAPPTRPRIDTWMPSPYAKSHLTLNRAAARIGHGMASASCIHFAPLPSPAGPHSDADG